MDSSKFKLYLILVMQVQRENCSETMDTVTRTEIKDVRYSRRRKLKPSENRGNKDNSYEPKKNRVYANWNRPNIGSTTTRTADNPVFNTL